MSLKLSHVFKSIQNDNVDGFREAIVDCSTIKELNSALQNKYGSSVFHLCAQYNAQNIFRTILTNGFHLVPSKELINKRDHQERTPLHVACIFGSIKMVRILIENAVEINALKRGDWSSLMITIAKSNLPLMNLLLENGCDSTLANKDGWNVAHMVVRTGRRDLAESLRQHLDKHNLMHLWYQKVNNGRNIMHIAAINRHLEMFEFIIENFDFNRLHSEDRCGVTPFMDAARSNSVRLCQMIQERLGPNFNVDQCDHSNRTALHMAAQTNACDTIKFLTSFPNCDLNFEDVWKQTPLFLAIVEGHLEATKLLIELGADTQCKDFKHRTLIDISRQFGQNRLTGLLVGQKNQIIN